jgi:ArsR family transcriptional regulator, zinc-responsive transcriptional repressor
MPPVSPDAATPVPERPAGPAGGVTALAVAHDHAPRELGPDSAPRRTAGTLTAAGDLLRALAAPVRIAIVLQLQEGERCVHELVDALAVAQPLISQHLRVLKSAGVVHGERHGREVMYRLVDEHLAHIVVDAVTHVEEGGSAARGEQREEA